MPYFRHSEVNFYFEECGTGVPLIFSHGVGGNLAQVRRELGELPGVRLIFYDNRAHGRTAGTADGARPSFSLMAADMAALFDHLEIPAAVVGGVSMGAGIALTFGVQYKSRTRALILSRPAWLSKPNPSNLAVIESIAEMIEGYGRERGLQLFENSEIYMSLESSFPYTARSLKETFSVPGIERNVSGFRAIMASTPFDSFDDLKKIDVPALVIGNRDDPIHPFEHAEHLAASIPFACLREIPPKSNGLEEHQRRFRSCVAEFMGGLLSVSHREVVHADDPKSVILVSGSGVVPALPRSVMGGRLAHVRA
jgi:pimeloyl-ACP methyl ester carboxylesterase